MKKRRWQILLAFQPLVFGALTFAQDQPASTSTVTVYSDEWELIGDLVVPDVGHAVPAVLMLNKAAGARTAYEDLARELEIRGIASLRLDLRGHGQSTNNGRFVPGEHTRSGMIWNAEADVISALQYLSDITAIDASRIAVVGASYSGEEMAEAGRLDEFAAAYVALSPGSFSQESIVGIDKNSVPWLFVTSRDERFLQEIRTSVSEQSSTVEQLILPGTAHATDLLREHASLAARIAAWLEHHLQAN